jgi:hypothetical protein
MHAGSSLWSDGVTIDAVGREGLISVPYASHSVEVENDWLLGLLLYYLGNAIVVEHRSVAVGKPTHQDHHDLTTIRAHQQPQVPHHCLRGELNMALERSSVCVSYVCEHVRHSLNSNQLSQEWFNKNRRQRAVGTTTAVMLDYNMVRKS